MPVNLEVSFGLISKYTSLLMCTERFLLALSDFSSSAILLISALSFFNDNCVIGSTKTESFINSAGENEFNSLNDSVAHFGAS